MKSFHFFLMFFYFSTFCQLNLNASSDITDYIITVIDTLPQLNTNCPFIENNNDDGYIDDDEYEVMEYCRNNRITTVEEISTNIIGTWELVGHGEGWVPTESQPCSNVEFTEFELVIEFTNKYIDTITTHNWEIVDGINYPYLDINPPIVDGMGFGYICSEYMFSDATPGDGNMYLYQKIQSVTNTKTVYDVNSNPIYIFPNPTFGFLNIEQANSNQEINSIHVYDLFGKAVSFKHSYIGDDLISLDLSDNIQGSYFLVIDQQGKLYHQKIVML